MRYYLAVDIGASSGRHILGWLDDGKLRLEEVYRFSNGMQKKNGSLCWDIPYLFGEILAGLKKCKEIGKIPSYMGIDTWAVDFVLLDEQDEIIGDTVGYRDKRTQGMDEVVYKTIPEKELYARTGIQRLIFNTVYQLTAVKEQTPAYLERAQTFLMIPDYLNFLLTGRKTVEYTNATSTQLVSPETKDWDRDLIASLGIPSSIFPEITKSGTLLGRCTDAIAEQIGYPLEVILPATHDTGSAVLAVPTTSDALYISSGTWSLMGVERLEADCSPKSQALNFTNEGGYDYRFRYLKNIMGLWMIQSVKKELGGIYSFDDICDEAKKYSDFSSRVDVNDDCFLAPENMMEEVKRYCRDSGQQVPENIGQLATVIYHSLAESYAETAREIEEMTGKVYEHIYIVGGGSKDDYLNLLTAQKSGKAVYAGPTEATAIGNLTAQMLGQGELPSLDKARETIYDSFGITEYK